MFNSDPVSKEKVRLAFMFCTLFVSEKTTLKLFAGVVLSVCVTVTPPFIK